MISSAINELILKLFDCASRGLPDLLAHLRPLMSCQNIRLMDDADGLEAANDIIRVEDDLWQHDTPTHNSPTHNSPTKAPNQLLQDCPNNPHALMLALHDAPTFDKDRPAFLIFEFDAAVSAQQILNTKPIHELMPHIQQAAIIAQQISEQLGDIQALQYVIQHHPLKALLNSTGLASTLIVPGGFTNEEQRASANGIFDLSISNASLIDQFKLSPSEVALAKALFQGLSLNDITLLRKVSKQTVRKQLQSILRKTGVESQEALILLLFDKCLLTRLETGSDLQTQVASDMNEPSPAKHFW